MRFHVITFLLCATAAAAACSSDDTGGGGSSSGTSGTSGGDTPDGQSPSVEGGVLLPDGATVLPDGAVVDDAGNLIDASTDAPIDAADAADAEPPPTYKHYEINHILSTGASDSVANGGAPYITTTQDFNNISFDTGVMTGGGCNDGSGCTSYQTPTAFKPLVEGDNFFNNKPVETMSSGLGNQANVFASQYFARVGLPAVEHVVLMSLHGRSGNPYWCERLQTENLQSADYYPCYFLKAKGYIAPFDEAMMQVDSGMTLAAAAGKTYVVRAVTAIAGQGESDSMEQNFTFLVSTDGNKTPLLNYTNALKDWQWDYETKVKAKTGQTEAVPMFISQFGSASSATPVSSLIPQRQLDAHTTSAGKINLVTPNYPMPHYSDCLHYTAHSERRLGAYFAKAYEKVVVEGKKWEPTRPETITRAGTTITVKYIVPVPPLVIDTTLVSPPVAANFQGTGRVTPVLGFIFRDGGDTDTPTATITNVAITAPDTVTITLSNVPTGPTPRLRYAYERQAANACPGPTNGMRGNIRDSDPTKAYHKDQNGNPYDLYNWSVAFDIAVP